MTVIDRAAFVKAAAFAVTAPAVTALESVIGTTKVGYDQHGNAISGLVTYAGDTYLYVAGELQKGVEKDIGGGIRYFSEVDGRMLKSAWRSDGCTAKHHGADGLLDNEIETPPTGSGWIDLDGRHYWYDSPGHIRTGWLVTDIPFDGTPGLERYWLDPETASLVFDAVVETPEGFTRCKPDGRVARGRWNDMKGHVYFSDNDGILLDMSSGWLVTAEIEGKLTGRPSLQRYYMMGDGSARVGEFSIDGARYFGRREGYVARGLYMHPDTGVLYNCDDGGKIVQTSKVGNLGGWDFTDWTFVERMAAHPRNLGSGTDWFISVDVEAPVRMVVFHRENGAWIPVAGWYCATGRKYVSDGLPREAGGPHDIKKKWLPGRPANPAGPGCCLDFIQAYPDPNTNDSAAFHAGRNLGEWGYTTHSCIAVTMERSRWLYDHIPLWTKIYIDGRCGGIRGHSSSGAALRPEEVHRAEIQDPFKI